MAQEAITEIDMDVFSRRIGPYFSWLESRIESGWQQSDNIQKDVLKEVKYLATTMRARFILGVSRQDFSKEVQRTLELFELATEAFPTESDEVESKIKHFSKGIAEELGSEFLPTDYKTETPKSPIPPQPHPFPMPEPMPGPDEPDGPDVPDDEDETKLAKPALKIKKETKKIEKPVKEVKMVKSVVKKEPKIAKPVIKKEVKAFEVKKETKIEKSAVKKEQEAKKPKKSKNKFSIIKWVKNTIYGNDL